MQESIYFELKTVDKSCNFLSLDSSPSQSQDDFETFTENLELNLGKLVHRNLLLAVVFKDFNAKSSNWFGQNKTSFERD